MRPARFLLVVLLSAAAVQHSECGRFWDSLKTGAKNVVSWVKSNCNMHYGNSLSFQCQFSGRKRTALDMERKAGMDAVCEQLGVDPQVLSDGFTMDAVQIFFDEVDADSGETTGVLDYDEYGRLMESLDLFRNCITAARA